MRRKANKADILLGVCYRPSNQDEEVDEVSYKRLAEVSQLLPLVLVGDFNLLDICWKYNTAERKPSTRFLECVEKKVGSTTYRRKGGQLKRSTGVLLGRAKRKLERQKPS